MRECTSTTATRLLFQLPPSPSFGEGFFVAQSVFGRAVHVLRPGACVPANDRSSRRGIRISYKMLVSRPQILHFEPRVDQTATLTVGRYTFPIFPVVKCHTCGCEKKESSWSQRRIRGGEPSDISARLATDRPFSWPACLRNAALG
jgi:hypothetical protein